ncbi:MAG: M20/M25/M40 family metallo-hydrolase [Sphingomonadales bacterium]|nr:M20/M25/M40 family metallo-hydrolase [Sphingomonadales bacterium]
MLGHLMLGLAAASAVSANPETPDAVAQILASPRFEQAQVALRKDHDRLVAEIIRLTEIPSPTFGEAERAKAYAEMMRTSGIADVGLDAIGNVVGIRRGRDPALPPLIVAAHLDTVFPDGTPVRVTREGSLLKAPGIGDDARGLAALLALSRAMNASGIVTDRDIYFVGTVGEEGRGNLRGVRHLFDSDPRARTASGFITFDLNGSDRIVTRHVGSRRYRIIFSGPGGHSFDRFGIVNPVVPLARTVTALYAMTVPPDPRTTYSASVISGGTSINTIPATAAVDIDIRSLAPKEIDRIDAGVRLAAQTAAREENAARSVAYGSISVRFEEIGERPAGVIDERSGLGAIAFAAGRAFGARPRFDAVSTDANLPVSLGIPAIAIGTGGRGGGEHSLEEFIDVEIEESLRGLNAGLVTVIAAASKGGGAPVR